MINSKDTNTQIERAIAAAIEFVRRETGEVKPHGITDAEGRFYPSEDEMCECCKNIRQPSKTWGSSLLIHCKTALHVSKKFGADPLQTRKIARLIRKNRLDLSDETLTDEILIISNPDKVRT